jgi:hypothetical protein
VCRARPSIPTPRAPTRARRRAARTSAPAARTRNAGSGSNWASGRVGRRRRDSGFRGEHVSETRTRGEPRVVFRPEGDDRAAPARTAESGREPAPLLDPAGTPRTARISARITRAGATATARPAKPLTLTEKRSCVRREKLGVPRVVVRPAIDDGVAQPCRTRNPTQSDATRARILAPDGRRARAHRDERLNRTSGATAAPRPAKPSARREAVARWRAPG